MSRNLRSDSVYPAVAAELRNRILSGELTGALPGVQLLAKELNVNFMTVDKALNLLAEEGHVHRVPRKGTFVSKLRTIALVMQKLDSSIYHIPIYMQLTTRLQEALSKRHCALVLFDLSTADEHQAVMLARRVDALVVVGGDQQLPEALRKLPAVSLLGPAGQAAAIDQFTYDSELVGKIAADYLSAQNCRQMIYLSLKRGPATALRQDAFLKRAGELGVAAKAFHDLDDSSDFFGAVWTLLQKWEASRFEATGIFASNDQTAMIATNYLLLNGKRPNRDCFVIGCNNSGDNSLPPELRPASIDLNMTSMINAAANRLFRRIDHIELPTTIEIVKPFLIKGGIL